MKHAEQYLYGTQRHYSMKHAEQYCTLFLVFLIKWRKDTVEWYTLAKRCYFIHKDICYFTQISTHFTWPDLTAQSDTFRLTDPSDWWQQSGQDLCQVIPSLLTLGAGSDFKSDTCQDRLAAGVRKRAFQWIQIYHYLNDPRIKWLQFVNILVRSVFG